MFVSPQFRSPTWNFADAAARAACTQMIEGDLGYQEDTKVWYSYDGASWNAIVTNNCSLIGSTRLGAGATSITFSSIASGYKLFMIEFRGSPSGAAEAIRVSVNNDTTAGHYVSRIMKDGTGKAGRTACIDVVDSDTANLTQNSEQSFIIFISNNATSDVKHFMHYGAINAGANIIQGAGKYTETTEISRIDIFDTASNMNIGTRASLFGFT